MRLTRRDLWLTLIPVLLWATLPSLRVFFITPYCHLDPARCAISTLNPLDRIWAASNSTYADQLSYDSQNLAGALALFFPFFYLGARFLKKSMSLPQAGLAWGIHLVLLLQSASLNGSINELTHIVTHRPRPFIYLDPIHLGDEASRYTSFYSGHTSFTAVATVSLYFFLRSQRAGKIWRSASLLAIPILTIFTAVCRVLAGRHFVTDVLFGAGAGFLVAFGVMIKHSSDQSE